MLADLVGFGAHIELFFFTANTQTMMPLPGLNFYCCLYPVAGQNFYACVWEFVPPEAACLDETNICARICSCNGLLVPDYAGFVRHVYDFDPENLFPPIPPTLPQAPPVNPGMGAPTWRSTVQSATWWPTVIANELSPTA